MREISNELDVALLYRKSMEASEPSQKGWTEKSLMGLRYSGDLSFIFIFIFNLFYSKAEGPCSCACCQPTFCHFVSHLVSPTKTNVISRLREDGTNK